MKHDVLAMIHGRRSAKGPSKETLNHPGIIELATGLDPYRNAPEAYRLAYQRLGIDIVNRVPDRPAPVPLSPGETRDLGNGYIAAHLGVYDTVSRHRFPFDSVEDFLDAEDGAVELDYHALITPVPHTLDGRDIERRSRLLGDVGVYYYQIYTTLFMWGVEYLGWEVFLLAGAIDPEALDRKLLAPAFEASRRLIGVLADTDCPFVFCHDDLADKRGPVFPPDWYDRHIFPRYPSLFEPARRAGKKVIYVADGNMEPFFDRLLEVGVDGVMLENPATNFDRIIEAFGDRIIIGGIETEVLQNGDAASIRRHVLDVHDKTSHIPGFAMSAPGGLHGSIPTENLVAYFDARAEVGYTPKQWRSR